MKIGSSTGQEIEFLGEPKYTEQFVYTNDRSKNKFYACKSDDAVTTDDVFKAFGSLGTWPLDPYDYYYDLVKDVEGTLNMFLIKGMIIHEPCFTYHNSGMYLTHATGLFPYPLNTLGNLWFSDFFREYRTRTMV